MPETSTDFQTRRFAFACEIVRLCRSLELTTVPRVVVTQLLRAGTSIGANLEEAKSAQSRKDLIAKFSIALKEARETRYWLKLLSATDIVPGQLTESALAEVNQLIAVLIASIVRLKGQQG